MADGIASTGTGISHDHDRAGETKVPLYLSGLLLRLVVGHSGTLTGAALGPNAVKKLLSLFHSAGGGANRHFEARKGAMSARAEEPGVGQCLRRRRLGQSARPTETGQSFFGHPRQRRELCLSPFGDPATLHRDGGEGSTGGVPLHQSFPSLRGVTAEGGDTTKAGNGDLFGGKAGTAYFNQ